MNKTPSLYVIAGCNGSGKSTFSKAVIPSHLNSFDYDKHFIRIYGTLFDSELRDRMAHNLARKELETAIEKAINNKLDFCYETNFNSTPLYWPTIFKNSGYKLVLIFFCLSSTTEAKRRVQIRIENGGHFVPEREIEIRFKQGYENLNFNYNFFNTIHLLDSNAYGKEPKHLISVQHNQILAQNNFPEYLQHRLPSMYRFIKTNI